MSDPIAHPKAFILSTGSEIVQGLYADTNAMHLSRFLTEAGFTVIGHSAAPDSKDAIATAIKTFGAACDLMISTGGLGPTEDDLTRDAIATIYSTDLKRVHRAEVMMRDRFVRRNRTMPERNLKQAFVPEGSVPLLNFWGTAPGFFQPAKGNLPAFLALPGPPHEWRRMIERNFPRLHSLLPERPATCSLTAHLAMVPESEVNERLLDLFDADANVDLTILASQGQIRVRVLARGSAQPAADDLAETFLKKAIERLPMESIFAVGPSEASLEEAVVRELLNLNWTVCPAESCTGGGVCQRMTNVSGSSGVLKRGFVTYSNEAKQEMLGVGREIFSENGSGAVSEECVRAMAIGAQQSSGANLSIAISGIAGPDGGTKDKPVGTVWFALAGPNNEMETHHQVFAGDRGAIRFYAENFALELLRQRALRSREK